MLLPTRVYFVFRLSHFSLRLLSFFLPSDESGEGDPPIVQTSLTQAEEIAYSCLHIYLI